MMYGSCNSQIFGVHEQASGFGVVGDTLTYYGGIDEWAKAADSTNVRIMRTRQGGEQWGWNYPDGVIDPTIRLICDSVNVPQFVWEGESYPDKDRRAYAPLITTDDRGASIIPAGGHAVTMTPIGKTILESLETDTIAASIPSWTADTVWTNVTDTSGLLKFIFMQECSRVGLKPIPNLAAIMAGVKTPNAYIHIWLKSASRILYAHYGQTSIPLILGKLEIDSDGIVSLA